MPKVLVLFLNLRNFSFRAAGHARDAGPAQNGRWEPCSNGRKFFLPERQCV